MEILVTATLLSFIVLGLLAVFNQTQRAFKGGMTQTDVLEGGRAVVEMMTREMEQITPSQDPYTTNFALWVSTSFQDPLLQGLPGSKELRKNVVQDLFFLSRMNTDWNAGGYRVLPEYKDAGVGTLYRWGSNAHVRLGSSNYFAWYQSAPLSNYNRVAEGVVHFRVRAFDPHGNLINPGMTNWPRQMYFYTNPIAADQASVVATNQAIPAFLELEMGMLEQPVYQRWKSLASAEAQRNYLSNNSARVHIFRQRVPVRNVDFSVYP